MGVAGLNLAASFDLSVFKMNNIDAKSVHMFIYKQHPLEFPCYSFRTNLPYERAVEFIQCDDDSKFTLLTYETNIL